MAIKTEKNWYPVFFIGLSLFIFIPCAWYLFYFFRQFLTLFGLNQAALLSKTLAVLFTAVCIATGWHVYDLRGVIVILFYLLLLATEIVNKILIHILLPVLFITVWSYIYRSGAVSIVAGCILLVCGFYHARHVCCTRYTVYTAKKLDHDITIAQISDLHMGITMNPEKLTGFCRTIESFNLDYLMLTGDIFDEHTSRGMMEQAIKTLADIKTKYGTYFVFGNHEDNGKAKKPEYTLDELRLMLTKGGIHVLENEAAYSESEVTLIGRKDRDMFPDRECIANLIPSDRKNTLLILLDHQPFGIQANLAAGIDLQLSGHTHGGQVWPTGGLGKLFRRWDFTYGMIRNGSYTLIVSSGLGTWSYPLRFASRSEYVIITVKSIILL